jgi:hypothetical protein
MTTKGTDYVLPYESVDAIFLAHLDLVHRQKSRCRPSRICRVERDDGS